jgi:hypothetical protein
MAAISDYLEVQLVKHLFRTGSYTKPTTLGIALFISDPAETGAVGEVSGGSYARVEVPPGDANWAATSGSDGHTSNVAAIIFPVPTADWGYATYFAIFDAAGGGNMLFHAALASPMNIMSGDPAPQFAAGELDVTFD